MEIIVSDADGSYSRALALASSMLAPGPDDSGQRKARQIWVFAPAALGGCFCPPVNLPLRNKAQYQSNMTASFQWINPGL